MRKQARLVILVVVLSLSSIITYADIGRGSGAPVVDIFAPTTIKQGEHSTLTIGVKNTGDDDGFNIEVTSKTGKLLLGSGSYTSQYIPAGTEKKFDFDVSSAGRMYTGTAADSITSVKEDIDVIVTPEHNFDARVTKTFNMTVFYNPIEGVTPKAPDFRSTYTIVGMILITLLLRKRIF